MTQHGARIVVSTAASLGEYCDGEIYTMAGGTPVHAELAASVIRLLGNARAAQHSQHTAIAEASTATPKLPQRGGRSHNEPRVHSPRLDATQREFTIAAISCWR